MDLAKDRLVGPFNFSHEKQQPFKISQHVWNELKASADPEEVDLGNLYKRTRLH